MKPSFPIRYKFLAVTSALLAFCVAAYLGLATTTLKDDKTTLVYELNKSFVANLASDLESTFQSISDKLELYALANADRKNSLTNAIKSLLTRSSDIAYLELVDSQVKQEPIRHTNTTFAQTQVFLKPYLNKDQSLWLKLPKKAKPYGTLAPTNWD
jgi:hypothetical protein